MSRQGPPPIPADDLQRIAAGVALFVGGMALAALLQPAMPWAKRPTPPPQAEQTPPEDA